MFNYEKTATHTYGDGLVYSNSIKDVITKTGHQLVRVDEKAAEHKANGDLIDGNVAYAYCSVCGKTYTLNDTAEWVEDENVIIVASHTFTNTVVAPTCYAVGYTSHTCDCGYSYNTDYTEALAHNYDTANIHWEVYNASTVTATVNCLNCTKQFINRATCTLVETLEDSKNYKATVTIDGKEYSYTFNEKDEQHVHEYTPKWTWTKTESGYSATVNFVCVCEVSTLVKADDVKLVSQTVATCTEDGVKVYKAVAEFNNQTYSDVYEQVIDKTNHAPIAKVAAKAATCEDAGNIEYWYCSDCGKFFSDEGETVINSYDIYTQPLEHQLDMSTVVWAWSEDYQKVTATVTCTVCGETVSFNADKGAGDGTVSGDNVTYVASVTIGDEVLTDTRTESTEAAKLAASKQDAIDSLKLYALENNIDLEDSSVKDGIAAIQNAESADAIDTKLTAAKTNVDTATPTLTKTDGTKSSGNNTAALVTILIIGGVLVIAYAALIFALVGRRKRH
jgi:hypothetical protein